MESSNATLVAGSQKTFDVSPQQETPGLYIDVEGGGIYSPRHGEVTRGCQTCSQLAVSLQPPVKSLAALRFVTFQALHLLLIRIMSFERAMDPVLTSYLGSPARVVAIITR